MIEGIVLFGLSLIKAIFALMTAREFEHIYRTHGKKLFRICLVFVKDENRAAEMVQDIFCSIWERRQTLQVKGNWEHYLCRAAKFKYCNNYRGSILANFKKTRFFCLSNGTTLLFMVLME